jgi:hypothetical protein
MVQKGESQRVRLQTTCIICQGPVSVKRLTCSKQCRIAASSRGKPLESRPCEVCGVIFKPRASKDPGKFCSAKCQGISVRKPCETCGAEKSKECTCKAAAPVKTCLECGLPFESRYWKAMCSQVCIKHRLLRKLKYRRQKKRQAKEIECVECGQCFLSAYSRARFCSKSCGKRASKRHRKYAKRTTRDPSEGVITITMLVKRDGNKCQLCGKRMNMKGDPQHGKAPSIDHIIPISLGGEHTLRNVQLAHRKCNGVKSNKMEGQLRLFG